VRRPPRFRTLIAAGAASFLAGTALTGAPPAAAAGTVRVMQFNICGAICNHGVIDKAGSDNDVVDDVLRRIVDLRPAVVLLNEVCVGQFERMKSRLDGGPWKMSGVFRAQRDDNRCRSGDGFGDAVLSAGGISDRKVLPLPNPAGGEHRAVLCARTTAAGDPVLACVLHTVTGNPMKGRQVAAAARAINAEASRGAVILGGDFNTTPSGMRGLLDPDRGGRFFDVDPQRAATRGDKIDYVLFSRPHFSDPSGGPQGSRYSDHDALVGQATRR
jgi:endonuclease/exonuclease/phosphatase family metal-dependent hydrolase